MLRPLLTASLLFAIPSAAWAVDNAATQQVRAAVVTVTKATQGKLVETVSATGTLVARDEVMVGPEIEGLRILELLAEEGDKVAKGQVLARLSRDQLDALLAQSDAAIARSEASIAQAKSQIVLAEANLKQAEPDLVRAQALMKQGATTQVIVEQRQTAVRTTTAQLQAARDGQRLAEAERASQDAQRRELMVRISRTEVRTPSAGIVTRRSAKLGAVATAAGEPMFRIIANGAIELEAEVPEARLPHLRVEQPATINVAGDLALPGKVRLVSSEVDKATRLGRVRIALDDSSKARVGSFGRGVIIIRTAEAVTVPASAILYDGGVPVVQVVRDGKIVQRRVKLGLVSEGRAELVEGVQAGEDIVARAGAFLRDGDAVTAAALDKGR